MEKEKLNIKFVALAENAMKYTEAPTFGTDLKWYKFGADDAFDFYLYDLRKKSPLNGGILDKKIKLDVGAGLVWNENNKKMNDFYTSLSKDFLTKSFADFEVVAGMFFGIKWYKQQIIEIEYIPFNYCRLGEENEKGDVEQIMFSKNFKKAREARYKPIAVPAYTGEYKKNDYEIAYVFKETQGQKYPHPVYLSNYIQIDWEVSKFHLSNVLQGFNPGMLIVFTEGTPTPEQERRIEQQIKSKSNPEGTGNYILYYAENKDNVPVITPIQTSQLHKQYEVLNNTIDSKILVGHQMPRILANVATEGSLGGSKEYLQASEVFTNDYVIPQQKYMLDFLNEINVINGIKDEVYIEQSKTTNNSLIIELLGELKDVLTKDEIRKLIGYEPLSTQQPPINII